MWTSPAVIQRSQHILNSYRHWLGKDLIPRTGDLLDESLRLSQTKFVVVGHGVEADPILNYANKVALDLWELDWEAFCSTPSRLTAEPMHRDERAEMLATTQRQGYIDNYAGIRISSTGKRFKIDQALVWNLIDENGQLVGQAATFSDWTWLD
ncbi:MAG: MEKHLA domain-containing protein [Planctomycetaceae bacterium]|nr:MEKHLA domain-containing protein [Planctomycetaceae bacterium]